MNYESKEELVKNYELKCISRATLTKALWQNAKYIEEDISIEEFKTALGDNPGEIREFFGKSMGISFEGNTVYLEEYEKQYGSCYSIIKKLETEKEARETFVEKVIDAIIDRGMILNGCYIFKIYDDIKSIRKEYTFDENFPLISIAKSIGLEPEELRMELSIKRVDDDTLSADVCVQSRTSGCLKIADLTINDYKNEAFIRRAGLLGEYVDPDTDTEEDLDNRALEKKMFSCSVVDLLR